MKLLFVTYDFPYPANSGGKVRAYNLLKFGTKSMEVILLSFVRRDFDSNQIRELAEIGISKVITFKRRDLKNIGNALTFLDFKKSIFKRLYFNKDVLYKIRRTISEEKIDLVHFESFYTAFYIDQLVEDKNRPTLVFGTENIEYKIYRDYSDKIALKFLKPLYNFEAKKIKREELDLFKKADYCCAVTEDEANYIGKISGKECYVVENGVDTDFFKFFHKKAGENKNILFVGNFTYFPNVDAATSFYENVFLKIKDKNIIFTIVGKNSKKLYFANNKKVSCFDFVDDIRSVYYGSDVFVFPLKFGGGTNFKILEAASCGVPVVAFPERIKSLNMEDKKHFLLSNSYEEFYEKINLLFSNEELGIRLTKEARKLVEENFSWQMIGKKINKIWCDSIK